MIHWAEYNYKQYAYDSLLLALISETQQSFPIPQPPRVRVSGLHVELVPLVLRTDGEPRLFEVGAGGRLISSYFEDRTWDAWGAEVAQQRIHVPAKTTPLPGIVERP